MREVEIEERVYRIHKMATRTQFHVAKRLIPVMQGFMPLVAAATTRLVQNESGQAVPDFGSITPVEGVAALTNTVGLLSDDDLDFILDAALDVTQWQQGQRWVPLRAPGGALLLGAADSFAVQLRLLWEALSESLEGFSLETLFPYLKTNGMDPTASVELTN